MPAKVVNDDASSLIPLGALEFIASMLAPTGERPFAFGASSIPQISLDDDQLTLRRT